MSRKSESILDLDPEFLEIGQKILFHKEFQKIKESKHHSTNIYAHSVGVAYYSFKIAKRLNLDTRSIVRGALLHDFFQPSLREKGKYGIPVIDSLWYMGGHPREAYKNAARFFKLNKKEKNIIQSHMWPAGIPLHLESWIVSFVDKGLALYEGILHLRDSWGENFVNRFCTVPVDNI